MTPEYDRSRRDGAVGRAGMHGAECVVSYVAMSRPAYTPVLGHPLEVFPWARRIPPSQSRDFVYTLILTILTIIIFTGIEWGSQVPLQELVVHNAIISLCISYSIHLTSFAIGRSMAKFLPQTAMSQRMFVVIIADIFAGAFGFWLGSRIIGVTVALWPGMMIVSIQVAVAMTAVAGARRRFMENQLELERERSARLEAERLTTVARLQTLQAQIEPHFLFNTLANVSSLIEIEPKQARKMLDELTLLLRGALDSTRRSTMSLKKELQLVEAYLSVLKIRMGDRLTYRVTAPDDLMTVEVPSMLLQPIVENAVKHGIEPRVRGGAVQVEVKRQGSQLLLAVSDDGVGFLADKNENVGLGVIRERLAVQFGSDANLNIERTPEQWTRVTICIPFPAQTKAA